MRVLYTIFGVVVFLSLAACQQINPVGGGLGEPITFENMTPIYLDVAAIRIDNQYHSPAQDPYIEHRFSQSPSQAVEQWTRDRLRAVGTFGTAVVVIEQASVVKRDLPRNEGISNLFSIDQSEEIMADLRVRIELENTGAGYGGFAAGQVQTKITLAENISLHEREEAWQALLNRAMLQLNDVLEQNIQTHLTPYVVR